MLKTTEWINFLAMLGSGVLTFLAGAEIDPAFLKANIRASMTIGVISFLLPFGPRWPRCRGSFLRDKTLVHRIRSIAFTIFTPFYFIKAGLYVSLPALWAAVGVIAILLALKLMTKFVGVWPLTKVFYMRTREANYTTLLMVTGLTFGTISALFGLQNKIIDDQQYTILVTVVILSAFVPTLTAQKFFQPTVETMIGWGKALCLYYDGEYRDGDADFEPCFPIRKEVAVDGISIRRLPGSRCLTVVHRGSYDQLGRSYAKILKQADERKLKVALPTREIYVKGPGMIFKGNPKNYLTEIQLPLT